MTSEIGEIELHIRREVYDSAMRCGAIPLKADLAESLGITPERASEALTRLADAHQLVLQPAGGEILMANPFSAVPTPFVVHTGGRSWYGNCIWDAMGIAAMLGEEMALEASCGCCGTAMQLSIPRDCRDDDERVAHFAIPAARWWDNIVFN